MHSNNILQYFYIQGGSQASSTSWQILWRLVLYFGRAPSGLWSCRFMKLYFSKLKGFSGRRFFGYPLNMTERGSSYYHITPCASPLISQTLLSILGDFNCAVVVLLSNLTLITGPPSLFFRTLKIVLVWFC